MEPGQDVVEDARIDQMLIQFKESHVSLDPTEAEESFSSFREAAGDQLQLVEKYLSDIKMFYNKINSIRRTHPDTFHAFWNYLVIRRYPSQDTAESLHIRGNEELVNDMVKLAFLRNHPQFYDKPGISIEMMTRAVDAKTDAAARAILEPVDLSSASGRVIQQGYNSPFLRFDEIIQPMLDTFNTYAKTWTTTSYFSPYAALIGPSMCGKSRSLIEMAKHICVVYVCLRPSEFQTSYPPRSALAEYILSTETGPYHYDTILAGIFQVVTNFFNNNVEKGTQDRLNDWNNYTEVAGTGSVEWKDRKQNQFTADVLKQIKGFPTQKKGILADAVKAMSDSTQFINPTDGSMVRVLLALDEARGLLKTPAPTNEISFFRSLCRTLRKIDSDKGFFAVLVDTTTSHVSNFSVASKFDPSARHGFSEPDKLYPPMYQIASFDAMVPDKPPKSWEELVSPERLFKYGSPVFGAYFRDAVAAQEVRSDIYRAILELAHFKLLGPNATPTTKAHPPKSLTKAQAFAFLGPIIQPRVNGAFHLNTELIASHAAHCDYISPGCDIVVSNYPSQFTLAAAALKFLKDEDKLVQCIKALTVFVLQGLNAAAGAGELASRIILFCAMQRALASTHSYSFDYGHPVRLVDFLKALTGVEAKDLDLGITDDDKKRDLLDNGMIFWNHFSLIKYSPSSKDLLKFMYRSMAAQCKQNQAGFDQIFTIYLKRDSESDDLKESNISFCGVQVKNGQSAIDLVKENYKWTDRFAKVKLLEENPYLVLFMDLHGIRPEDKDSNNTQAGIPTLPDLDTIATRSSSERTDHRRASLVFHGLDHFHCLSQPVTDALKALIDTEPDFVKLNTTESGKLYSRTINPCLYSTE